MIVLARGGKAFLVEGWAERYAYTVLLVKRAADSRNHTALAAAGDTLTEVCEGCHVAVAPAAHQ